MSLLPAAAMAFQCRLQVANGETKPISLEFLIPWSLKAAWSFGTLQSCENRVRQHPAIYTATDDLLPMRLFEEI